MSNILNHSKVYRVSLWIVNALFKCKGTWNYAWSPFKGIENFQVTLHYSFQQSIKLGSHDWQTFGALVMHGCNNLLTATCINLILLTFPQIDKLRDYFFNICGGMVWCLLVCLFTVRFTNTTSELQTKQYTGVLITNNTSELQIYHFTVQSDFKQNFWTTNISFYRSQISNNTSELQTYH